MRCPNKVGDKSQSKKEVEIKLRKYIQEEDMVKTIRIYQKQPRCKAYNYYHSSHSWYQSLDAIRLHVPMLKASVHMNKVKKQITSKH